MQTVRTTIRLDKDLLDQYKMLALKKGTSLQAVVNTVLRQSYPQVASLKTRRELMARIDRFREEAYKKHGYINTQELIDENKRELQERADRALGIHEEK